MVYVGAFVIHGNDTELFLVIGEVSKGNRVRLRKWSNGSVRTAKESDIAVIPAQEAIMRLRALLVADTPAGTVDRLEGQQDLIAAAYDYMSGFKQSHPPEPATATRISAAPKATRSCAHPTSSSVVRPTKPSRKNDLSQGASANELHAHKQDFIREGVIIQMVTSNVTISPNGHVEVLGSKVDLYRLIQIYCATVGVTAPTKSLVLRRIHNIQAFIAQAGGKQTGLRSPRELLFDIKGMEP
ncbi:hypothetical protein B8W72_29835 [Pseudomonas putida]|uniref:Uncharacterized protein n=1 Tax=Pseudomonas putida TaxID=303 RepID=A0A1Y3KC87_PSEPU|nr:hypothetical protein [Pseudomonas putida]OUM22654.1 hypothetical protein B8W72_29835 [Pseudomonas putida]